MKLVIVLSCLLVFATSSAMAQWCSFEILVKTGDRKNAGTDARISLVVAAADGPSLVVSDLQSRGASPAGRDYFERGNEDRFITSGPCMPSEPCFMDIKSDGTGNKPGWYVDYVIVTQVMQGSSSSLRHKWNVDQWLATDEAPNTLEASRNVCR